MNAIRRRLLRWGAGRLATALFARGARQIQVMAVSDVIGDEPAVIGSAPCTPDPLELDDVLALCDARALRSVFPPVLARAIGLAGDGSVAIVPPAREHPAFARVQYHVILGNADACRAVEAEAREAGIADVIRADELLSGDAEWLGDRIVQVALQHARTHREGAVLIWGGEPTVHVAEAWSDDEADQLGDAFLEERHDADPPLGGRMQALALAAALTLEGGSMRDAHELRITLLAAGTDGRDGPTDAAGAIIDTRTAVDIRRAGRDPERDLRRRCSHPSLEAAGALLRTGPSGTNVMDVVIVHIAPMRG